MLDLDLIPTRDLAPPTSSAATANSTRYLPIRGSREDIPFSGASSSHLPAQQASAAYAASTASYVSDWMDNSSMAMSELRRQRQRRR